MKKVRSLIFLLAAVVLIGCLAACQPQVVEVEITRIVTETVVEIEEVGGETVEVEVTRVVTETVIEEIIVEVETEAQSAGDDDLEATGVKDGDGTPFDPGSETKVISRSEGAPTEGWIDTSGEAFLADGDEASIERAAAEESGPSGEEIALSAPVVDEVADAPAELAPTPAPTAGVGEQQVALLTAGNVDDNLEWDAYIAYRNRYAGPEIIEVDITQRHQIFVRDTTGFPVLGAVLSISNENGPITTLRTHSDGRAYFFPSAFPNDLQAETYTVGIEAYETLYLLEIDATSSQREWLVEVAPDSEESTVEATNLDVLFLIDTTGSMGDEIDQLKENITFIAEKIEALPSSPDVRYGMTVYKDRGDEYVSRTFEFTPDVAFFAAGLDEVTASGGGDYPEDLNEGLFKAVRLPEWRVENTVSLLFLVADAPPQLFYEDQTFSYATEMRAAAHRGIKIYPIASSGIDSQGEYIFRQIAQYTGGRFLFLTYGAGGAGTTGGETDLNVDGYDVTSLDGLVIKIIEEEMVNRER